MINRRDFLKLIAISAGVAFVPEIGVTVSQSMEPVRWLVEEFDYGNELGVAAQWRDGPNSIRRRILISNRVIDRDESVTLCKQALRQWYAENHGAARRAA